MGTPSVLSNEAQQITSVRPHLGIDKSLNSSPEWSNADLLCEINNRNLSNSDSNSQKGGLHSSNCEVEKDCGSVVGIVVTNKVHGVKCSETMIKARKESGHCQGTAIYKNSSEKEGEVARVSFTQSGYSS